MRQRFATFLLAAATPLLAQSPADPLAAPRQKLRDTLAKAANTADTAFTIAWAENAKKPDEPVAVFLGGASTAPTGAVRGSWHDGLTHLVYGEDGDEFLLAGRRMLAKDKKSGWCLRAGRFADGNTVGFLPDVPLLLQRLATWDLALTQRTVGSLDDRPVEILSVTLNPDQVAEAVWAGLLPDVLAPGGNPFAQVIRFGALPGNNARVAAEKPGATVDLALFLDPSTNTLHELRFRSWTKVDAQQGGRMVFVRQGGAVVQAAGAGEEEEDEEDEEQAAAAAKQPLEYADGLPLRKRSKMLVRDFTVRLTEHGSKPAPALTDEQAKLLAQR